MIIYNDLGDAFNKTKFEVRCPESYRSQVSKYYQRFPDRAPIAPMEHQWATSMVSCAEIVDMSVQGIHFTVVRPEDFIHITSIIEGYASQAAKALNLADKNLVDMDDRKEIEYHIRCCNTTLQAFSGDRDKAHDARMTTLKSESNVSLIGALRQLWG